MKQNKIVFYPVSSAFLPHDFSFGLIKAGKDAHSEVTWSSTEQQTLHASFQESNGPAGSSFAAIGCFIYQVQAAFFNKCCYYFHKQSPEMTS